MLSGAPPTKTESCDAPQGTGAGTPPFPALWWCEHMCPGWPRHSAWVSGPGEPASPRLEACAPVGSRRLWAGLAGTAGCQGPPVLTLTFSGHPARGGQRLEAGKGAGTGCQGTS